MALVRFNKFIERHADKGVTAGGLRWKIFNADKNGMAESGALVRKGREIWIDEEAYFGPFLRGESESQQNDAA